MWAETETMAFYFALLCDRNIEATSILRQQFDSSQALGQ